MLSKTLNDVIVTHTNTLIERLGFGYVPDVMAPTTYWELLKAFDVSKNNLIPLPIYDGGSSSTIYGNKDVNFAFRFWHDVEHVMGRNNFTLKGEIATAYRQLSVLESIYGFGPTTIEWKLLYADIVGQIKYYYEHRRFVENQIEFVTSYVKSM